MCAMQQPSFLADIFNQVQCAVCLELFNEPHSLQCRHTFCKQCLENLAKDGQITCPTCRKETPLDSIVSDFLAKGFVEAYQKQAEAMKTKLPKPDTKCEFCELRWMQFFCHNCHRAVCDTCLACHCKLTRCELEQAEKVKSDFQDFVVELQVEQKKLDAEMDKVCTQSKNILEKNSQIAENCITLIKEDQAKTLEILSKWYEQQIDNVRATETKSKDNIENLQEELLVELEKNTKTITQTIEDGSIAQDHQEDLKRQLEEEIARLKSIQFTPVECNFSNNADITESFCPTKVLKLKESIVQIDRKSDSEFKGTTNTSEKKKGKQHENLFQQIKRKGLQVEKSLIDFRESFLKLQVVDKEILVLYSNRINIFNICDSSNSWSRCQLSKAITNSQIQDATDMYVDPRGEILLTQSSGVFQCTPDFSDITCLTEGNFVAIIPTATDIVWAVKVDSVYTPPYSQFSIGSYTYKSEIFQYKYCDNSYIHSGHNITLNNCQLGNGTALDTKLFFNVENRILELDTETQKKVEHGITQTKQNNLGELSSSFKVFSDHKSEVLLILDRDLNRLVCFDPKANSWFHVHNSWYGRRHLDCPTWINIHENILYLTSFRYDDFAKCKRPSLYRCSALPG